MASQTIPTPVVGPTISNTGYCVLWYLMAPALMEAGDTNGGVAYTLIGGGGEIDWSDIYRPNGYIGNVTIRTRHPGTAFTYPSNDGVITFATAVPTVAPAIQTQPVGASVFVGSTVSLSVSATGQPAPTYQWRKNGVDLAGATATTLTLPNVQVGDSGSYVAVATNSAGTAQSNAASLTVSVPPPTIVTQPSNRTTYAGEAVGLSVVASGAPAPGYQWYRNGVPVVDATGANLIISNPQIADAGSYSVVVANAYGSVTSANVTLTVNPARPPIITSAASITGTINTPLSYHFSTHVPASSYIWDEGNLPDGVGRFGVGELIQGTPSQTGYFVLKFRAWGAVGQGPQFTLTITINGGGPNQIVPTISSQPSDRTVAAGGNTILSVGVSGPGPISYEWRKNGSVVPGEVYSSLFITNVSANHVGEYSVRVANPFGFAVSLPAVVTVTGAGGGNLAGPPAIYRHPQSQAVRPGGNVVLSVDATSALPFTYQWRKGGVALVGQTNADLALLGFTANDADYYDVIVANSAGFVQSDTAALSLDQYAQEIRFLPLPNRAFPVFDATTTITLKAVATSLLPVTFSVVSGPATVTGNILTVTGAGVITVRAAQAGAQNSPTGTYSPASLDREFTVVQGTPPPLPGAMAAASSLDPKRGRMAMAITAAPPKALWRDLDGDGIPEEITPAGVNNFDVSFDVQQLLDLAFGWDLLEEKYRWVPVFLGTYFDPDADGGLGAMVSEYDFVQVPDFSASVYAVVEEPTVDIFYTFLVHPGYEYFLFGEYNHRYGDNIERWPSDIMRPVVRHTSAETGGISAHLTIADFDQPLVLASQPYYVIRKGLAPAGVQINLPGIGDVTIAKGTASGTITLPNGTKVTATASSASIALPGGAPVAPGGNGTATSTLPSGATITAGSGGATFSIPGGPTITLNGSNIGLSVPAGATTAIGNAVDSIGRLLGLGGAEVRGQILPQDGQPAQGAWGDIRNILLGDRPPGVYDIATTTDTRGVPESPTPPAPANIIRIRLTVTDPAQPALPLRSRDRYLTGSIDTSGSFYRVNDLEFVNTATNENLGKYRLDGSTGTFVYNSESDIFSETELDGLESGSLPANSLQLTQQVVFWKESPGSSKIQFCTIFNALGPIEIRVKNAGGTQLYKIEHTLTAESTFAALLDHLDLRLSSMEMPPRTPWSMLPAIEGVDDEDEAIGASPVTPPRIAAMTLPNIGTPTIAQALPALNLRAKGARVLDLALLQTAPPLHAVTAEEIKGLVDGIWDGIVSDATGLWDLAEFASDHPVRQAVRTILFFHSVRGLFVQLQDKAARDALAEAMFERFEAKARASVPWAYPEDALAWSAPTRAWMRGYIRGFGVEQIAVAMLGAGIVTKPALATKAATEAAKLADLTTKPIRKAQRFVVGAFLSASRKAAIYGDGAMRSARKTIAEVAIRPIEGAATVKVGDEMVILMDRFAATEMSWQKVGNELYLVVTSEGELLRIGLSAYPLLAKLSYQMGTTLSASGVRGWLNLWKGALRNGANGHFADKLELVFKPGGPTGVLDIEGLAKVLEMFDGAGASTYKFTQHPTDPTKWISPAGLIYEKGGAEGHRIMHLLSHAFENLGRTAQGRAHGVFTIPREQIFPFLDYVKAEWANLPKVPVPGQRYPTWDVTLPTVFGKADNIPGTAIRQASGYNPSNTLRIAIENTTEIKAAFPINP
jgi:hypothetical protein